MRRFDVAEEEMRDSASVADGMGAGASTADGALWHTPASPVRWRRVAGQAVALWLATRAALLLFTGFAVAFRIGQGSPSAALTPHDLALHWQRWDALWYLGIAQRGYFSPQATAFFPLYPLLTRVMSFAIGTHWLAAALIVANLGTLVAFIGMALLAAREAGAEAPAWGALRVLAAYPLAFFLAAPYSDGLFLACVAFGLLAARQRRWGWAVLCTFLALLDRPTGVVLLVPVLWEYGHAHGLSWRNGPWSTRRWRDFSRASGGAVLLASAAALGLGAYMLFLWHQFGDPLLFLHAEQQFWHHQGIVAVHASPSAPQAPVQASHSSGWSYEVARSLVDLAPVALFALLAIAGAKRLPISFTLYMACLLLVIISSPRPDRLGFFVSAGRYFIAAAPAFLLLGRWVVRRPWLDLLLVSGGFLLQAVFAAYFLAGGWMV